MTSFISAPRRCLTLCSPNTQAIASATLLLPQPFGPTTAVIPSPVKMRSVWSAKDLKPVISRRLSLNIDVRHLMRGVTGIKGDESRRQYKGTPPTCQPKLQLRNFNCRRRLSLASARARSSASRLGAWLTLQQKIYAAAEAFRIGRLIAQQMGIKEDRWRAGHAQRSAALDVGADSLIHLVTFHVAAELLDIQTKFARIRDENWTRIRSVSPGALIAIEPIMHLPKLLLIARGLSGMRRNQGVLVHPRQGKVMKDDLHLVTILAFDFLQLRIKLAARRALIVAVLFEHDRRTHFEIWFRRHRHRR